MDERSKWIDYKGKKLFLMDLSDLDEENQMKVLERSSEEWISSNEKTILLLNDVRNAYMTEKIKTLAQKAIQEVRNSGKKMLIAIIGTAGIKRIIANAVEKGSYFSKDIEDAKEWLFKQE